MQNVLQYIGSAVIMLWGIGHLVPTRNVVRGFGQLTPDNTRIIVMEWIGEGLTLTFLGLLVLLITATGAAAETVAVLVIRACAGMLLVLAIVSAFTGARTTVLPMKACPFVKTTVAVLYLAGTLV